jgi:hypothetical protein
MGGKGRNTAGTKICGRACRRIWGCGETIYRVSILGNMRTCSPATSAIAMGGADGVEKLECDLRCNLGEGDSDSWP